MACPGGWKAFGTKIKFRMNDIWLQSQKVNKRRNFAIPSKFDLGCRRKRKVNEELKLEKFFEQGLAYSVFSVILTEVHSYLWEVHTELWEVHTELLEVHAYLFERPHIFMNVHTYLEIHSYLWEVHPHMFMWGPHIFMGRPHIFMWIFWKLALRFGQQ